MSIEMSPCFLTSRALLAKGLGNFDAFTFSTFPQVKYDPWPKSRQSLSLEAFLDRLDRVKQPVFKEDEIFRLALKRREKDQEIVLWLTGEMQELFQLTAKNEFLLLNLGGLPLESDRFFIPFEHPAMSLIQDVVPLVDPIYGWLEADFVGTEDNFKIWHRHISSFPTATAPWHLPSSTRFIGQFLSEHINPYLPQALSDNRQFFRRFAAHLFCLTRPDSPGTFEAYDPSASEVANIFKQLPASMLKQDGSRPTS